MTRHSTHSRPSTADFSAEQRRWLAEMGHSLWRHADPETDRAQAAAAERERRTLWLVGGKGHARFVLPAPLDDLAAEQRQLLDAIVGAAALRHAEALADLPAPRAADAALLELPTLGPLSVAERRALWPRLRAFRLRASGEPSA